MILAHLIKNATTGFPIKDARFSLNLKKPLFPVLFSDARERNIEISTNYIIANGRLFLEAYS